jgi:hypothetical protein
LVTEYDPEIPAQTALAAPLIVPGVAGVLRVMVNVRAMLLPHALFETTLNIPEVVNPAV